MSQHPQRGPRSTVHLLDRLAVIAKHYKVALAVCVLVITGMMCRAYTTVPMYLATARIHIEEEQTARVGFEEASFAYQDAEPFYHTQYKILQSRDLARRAVRRLKLETVPEFNGKGPTPTKVSQITALVTDKVLAPFRRTPAAPQSAPGRVDGAGLVAAFLSRVRVAPVKGSRLVDVSFTSSDAAFAATAINVLAEEYVAQNIQRRLDDTDKALQWLNQEVARQQGTVQGAERLLAEYRSNQNAPSLENRQNLVVSRLNEVNYAVTEAQTRRVRRESIYRQATNATQREALTPVIQNALIQDLRTRLTEIDRDRSRLLDRYGEKHPDVRQLTVELDDVQRQIDSEINKTVDGIRNDYEVAVAEERSLSQDLEGQKAAAMALNRKGIDYSILERNAKSNRQLYDSLLQREKELQVVSNSRANNVRLLDAAPVPAGPYAPNIDQAWMIALFVGLGFGVAAAFTLEHLDDTVKTPEDVKLRLKLHFLGLVPKVRGESQPLLSGKVTHEFGEAFRAVRTALVMTNPARSTRIVAVTSAQPLEGKTTTAINMALALAIGGARVLLIDADMRRPSLHKALRIPNDKGLADVLAGQAQMREVIHDLPNPNLLVITAGSTPRNPSELLASMTMKMFLEQAAGGPFDWVIIDTPPVMAVTDAVILAPLMSSVTFVLGAETTRLRLAERAIETLQAARPQSINAVLNKVDCNRYYYTRYYGRPYHSYYAQISAAA